jgi:hypothetical protein
MTPQQARAAIETAFKAEWGTTIPVDYTNDMASVPPPPFARLSVRISGDSVAQSMTGDRIRYERFGIVHLQVFTALGIGPAAADTLIRKGLDILESRRLGTNADPINLGAGSQNDVGTTDNGLWQVNLSVPVNFSEYRTKRYG